AIDWLYSNAAGGIKVVIREEDYDAAADILDFPAEETQEPVEDEDREETPATSPSPQCPACGLTTIAKVPKFRLFAWFFVLFFGVGMAVNQIDLAGAAIAVAAIALVVTPSHRCTTCGERFNWLHQPDRDESPLPQDLQDETCPRCGSIEIHRVYHRRLKALGLFQPFVLLVVALWPFLPKRVCDACGFKSY
ncbi:MAG TPA: hypothetical protein VF381_08485, partial [Thermoanaerobaculia bacterium]